MTFICQQLEILRLEGHSVQWLPSKSIEHKRNMDVSEVLSNDRNVNLIFLKHGRITTDEDD